MKGFKVSRGQGFKGKKKTTGFKGSRGQGFKGKKIKIAEIDFKEPRIVIIQN
jgi:hypothetical protein